MSPLYTVFRPHDVDTTYLEHFFKCAYWHSFMNFNGDSGARSDRFSIKNDVFTVDGDDWSGAEQRKSYEANGKYYREMFGIIEGMNQDVTSLTRICL